MAQTTGLDRRHEPRALTAALIEVTDEYDDTSTCVLEDLSSNGAYIHSDIRLEVGSQVKIKAGTVVHAAVVKHCKPNEFGFSVGIEFGGARWPAPIELPIHWMRMEH